MKRLGKDNCYVEIEYGVYGLVMPITRETADRLMGSNRNKRIMRVKLPAAGLDELLEILEVREADPSYKFADMLVLDEPQPTIGEIMTVYRNMEPVLKKSTMDIRDAIL